MTIVDADAHEQVQVACRNPVRAGRPDDLLQLLDRIEAERLHVMVEIGLGDDLFGLHRVHEADHRLGQHLMDQADLADRGDVVMRDARVPQDIQEIGRWVRLHRVERAAGKLFDKKTGGPTRGVWTKKRHRLDRSQLGDIGTPPDAGRGGR